MRFLSVVKPGIILGNIVSLSGGFFLASRHFEFWLYLATVVGMALVMACGCVLNNYIDRDIDKLMERTKNRVLVKGLIRPDIVVTYAIVLGTTGIAVLAIAANLLSAGLALAGLLVYVLVYSLYAKRHSFFGTEIGAIAGALVPVVGYCAVSNSIDIGAVLVFLILFCWQMPHSYALAICFLKDYSAANIPVLPLSKTIYFTKVSSLLYTVAFWLAALAPALLGYVGKLYFIVVAVIGLWWIYIAVSGFATQQHPRWARTMFKVSIFNVTLVSIMMAVKI